jgi:hypothetical protein
LDIGLTGALPSCNSLFEIDPTEQRHKHIQRPPLLYSEVLVNITMEALSKAESDISFAARKLEHAFKTKSDESVQKNGYDNSCFRECKALSSFVPESVLP